jgi:cbb3-type cytochrome oxidase subunit 3
MKKVHKQVVGIWLILVILAVINGILRDEVYGPRMDELTAHQISTVIGIALFFVAIYVFCWWQEKK